MTDITV